MSFIGKQDVFHGHPTPLQVIHYLFSFYDGDVGVIGAVQYDGGCLHLIELVDWRQALQQSGARTSVRSRRNLLFRTRMTLNPAFRWEPCGEALLSTRYLMITAPRRKET